MCIRDRPLGECKSDQRIIYELGDRFAGRDHRPWDSEQDFYDYLLRSTGFTYDSLKERAWACLLYTSFTTSPVESPSLPASTGFTHTGSYL